METANRYEIVYGGHKHHVVMHDFMAGVLINLHEASNGCQEAASLL